MAQLSYAEEVGSNTLTPDALGSEPPLIEAGIRSKYVATSENAEACSRTSENTGQGN